MEKDQKEGQERKRRGLLLTQLTSSAHGFKSDTGSVHVVKCATKQTKVNKRCYLKVKIICSLVQDKLVSSE